MKPSNVLVFEGTTSKVADLGSAVSRTRTSPREHHAIAGDELYAPPELQYGAVPTEWNSRRFGCDAYLLGSLTVFLFTKTSMTALMSEAMDGTHHWRQWRGTFDDVLPYLRAGFGEAIERFKRDISSPILGEQLSRIVSELCDPDPRLRGHPSDRRVGANQYALTRYVSEFDLMTRKAELGKYNH